jgi:hypothetical protein
MERTSGNNHFLTGKAVERYFDLNKVLFEFDSLFPYEGKDERSIAILGGTFLEMILEHILLAFLPEDEKEVNKLMEFNQPLGNFSNKITMAYCLGLLEKIVKDDLNLIRKIRNKFAHDLYATFDDEQVKSWCEALKWHKILLTPYPPEEATTRDLFQVGVHTLISHLNGVIGIARSEKRAIQNNF